MIVEPAPAAPRGRRHRVAWVIGIVLPVVLLAGAITAALAGPRPDRLTAPTPVVAQGQATAPAGASPVQPAPVTPVAPRTVLAFPTVAADLGVLSVQDAAARIDAATPGPLAVAGYLAEVSAYAPCAAANGDARGDPALCLRHARLDSVATDPESAPHLDITISPGTRLPTVLDPVGGAGRPVPVVLVGHRGPRTDPCHPTTSECNGTFVVERVTWADGEPFNPGPVFDAYLDVAPPGWPLSNLESAETLAIGWSGTILQAALLRRASVAWFDSDAARVMAPSPTVATLVWYVLGLETGYDPERHLHGSAPPRYSWVVVDYVTGETLARGPERLGAP